MKNEHLGNETSGNLVSSIGMNQQRDTEILSMHHAPIHENGSVASYKKIRAIDLLYLDTKHTQIVCWI